MPLPPASGTGKYYALAAKSIRLIRQGCTNRPFFHISVTHRKRLNQYPVIEQLGSYDPMVNMYNEKLVALNLERIRFWLGKGAHVSKPVAELFAWFQQINGLARPVQYHTLTEFSYEITVSIVVFRPVNESFSGPPSPHNLHLLASPFFISLLSSIRYPTVTIFPPEASKALVTPLKLYESMSSDIHLVPCNERKILENIQYLLDTRLGSGCLSGLFPVHPRTYMKAWRNRKVIREQQIKLEAEKAQAKTENVP
ncbi:Probable 28S ribosomal protein S16, mitochondrial [Eumeta japonica]|uniref:Small ribosomal subunit protein bS16m n=1 Tax=Eumeta variegata TaxID=151549 RepID=A0A4C1TCQ8_EUMVA|nr:Probable 28S ribosomal protein S16, mitochondrial [Eumeta japonica]